MYSPTTKSNTSYSQILKSSSIIGGSQGIVFLLGILRTKMVAIILGPAGVGLVGMYVSTIGLIGTIASLGLEASGVREIASASATGDETRVAKAVCALRRICYVTGALGWLLTIICAWPLSKWTFGSPERMWPITVLGVTLLFGALTSAHASKLQGLRRLGDLAKIQILAAASTTVLAIALYASFAESAILPVIILTTVIQFSFTWYFSQKIKLAEVSQSWLETFATSKRLLGLGVVLTYGTLLSAFSGIAVRSLIIRQIGLDANGHYQAAWAISGMFAGFILTAMGTDFFPRLTAAAHDNDKINQLVNEQTEIAILLALPGLLITLAFAPWIMRLLYSAQFVEAAPLLPWFVLGVFGQVLISAIGYIQRAKSAMRWILIGQTEANVVNLLLCIILIPIHGIIGVAYAWFIHIIIHSIVVYQIGKQLSVFRWTWPVLRLILLSSCLIGGGFACQKLPGATFPMLLGSFVALTGCLLSMRGVARRLGQDHRVVKTLYKIPGVQFLCTI